MKNPFGFGNFGFLFLCILSAVSGFAAGAQNPVVRKEATVRSGNARFTVLTPEMIRIEYSDKGLFEDRATFAIQNREMDVVPSFTQKEDNDFLYIETDRIKLKYRKGTNPATDPASPENLTITMPHNGQEVVWYPGKPDPLNLKGTCRTLDGSDGDNKRAELENGLISRSGWGVIDDSWTSTHPDGSRSFALEPNDEVGFEGGASGKIRRPSTCISWDMARITRRRWPISQKSQGKSPSLRPMCSATGTAAMHHIPTRITAG